jgi:uncharacterized protein
MQLADLPPFAAFQHRGARDGFEVVFFAAAGGKRIRVDGSTAAVEDGEAWSVGYSIELDRQWRTRRATVRGRAQGGEREIAIDADGAGRWKVDGEEVPALDGCLDLDLESSSLTNAFPMRRLSLEVGQSAQAPAAYVRVLDLRVERLEQSYERLPDGTGGARFDYASPRFGFRGELEYDASGLVIEYPGIATRTA